MKFQANRLDCPQQIRATERIASRRNHARSRSSGLVAMRAKRGLPASSNNRSAGRPQTIAPLIPCYHVNNSP